MWVSDGTYEVLTRLFLSSINISLDFFNAYSIHTLVYYLYIHYIYVSISRKYCSESITYTCTFGRDYFILLMNLMVWNMFIKLDINLYSEYTDQLLITMKSPNNLIIYVCKALARREVTRSDSDSYSCVFFIGHNHFNHIATTG